MIGCNAAQYSFLPEIPYYFLRENFIFRQMKICN